MDGEVIKSFLVGLGFGVDEKSLATFNKAISSAAVKITALYASTQAAAAGIFYSITKMSAGFEEIGYQLRLVAPAVNKMLILRQAMLDAYSKAGIDLTKVVQQSILFNYSLAKTKFALDAIWKSVGAKFLPLLTKQMDIFRLKIFQNMPKIQAQLTKLVNFIFKAFEATVELGSRLWSILGRVYDFFVKLDEATNGWSTKILAVIAVWQLLNLEFLATPLGMLLSGFLAILALYDDFKTFQEGGKSFFDWSSAIPVINAISDVIGDLKDRISDTIAIVFDLVGAIVRLFHLDFSGFAERIGWMFTDLGKLITNTVGLFKDLYGVASSVAGWASHLVGGGANANANLANVAQPAPLLPSNSNSNQKVTQETNITVQGSADAGATGKAVASQQGQVNFDMVRNLKGAMR